MMCIHCDNHVDYHSDECVTHELFKLKERIHLLERELRRVDPFYVPLTDEQSKQAIAARIKNEQ